MATIVWLTIWIMFASAPAVPMIDTGSAIFVRKDCRKAICMAARYVRILEGEITEWLWGWASKACALTPPGSALCRDYKFHFPVGQLISFCHLPFSLFSPCPLFFRFFFFPIFFFFSFLFLFFSLISFWRLKTLLWQSSVTPGTGYIIRSKHEVIYINDRVCQARAFMKPKRNYQRRNQYWERKTTIKESRPASPGANLFVHHWPGTIRQINGGGYSGFVPITKRKKRQISIDKIVTV